MFTCHGLQAILANGLQDVQRGMRVCCPLTNAKSDATSATSRAPPEHTHVRQRVERGKVAKIRCENTIANRNSGRNLKDTVWIDEEARMGQITYTRGGAATSIYAARCRTKQKHYKKHPGDEYATRCRNIGHALADMSNKH
jgi:hypothetical protein